MGDVIGDLNKRRGQVEGMKLPAAENRETGGGCGQEEAGHHLAEPPGPQLLKSRAPANWQGRAGIA